MVASLEGIVLAKRGGRYRVHVGGAIAEATVRGRLKQRGWETVLVGDRVELGTPRDGAVTIERVSPRTSVLRRRMPGRTHGVRDVAANVEQVVIVGAAADPPWSPHLIDRFAAVAAANGLPVTIVVNKCDLVSRCRPCGAPYTAAGYAVVYTSVPEHRGIEELRPILERRTSLFTGSTGVGKSSLLNVLQPGLALKTGTVSERDRTGRHTTVAAEMHPLGREGYVVDTPGLRDIGLWGLDPSDVLAAFPDVARWATECRFADCRHRGEPDCSVVTAVERGELVASRLRSYHQLLDEAHLAARPWEKERQT